MSTLTSSHLITPEEFLTLPDQDRYELVDGELVELNLSKLSSLVGMTLGALLFQYLEASARAWVFGPDCGYRCFPDAPNKVRKPDVSVILRERMSSDVLHEEGWTEIPPDLAVEVISPHDTAYDVDTKVAEYLAAGVRLIWVVNPELRIVHGYRADGSVSRLREADPLSGEDLLPGFACPTADLFPARAVMPSPDCPSAASQTTTPQAQA